MSSAVELYDLLMMPFALASEMNEVVDAKQLQCCFKILSRIASSRRIGASEARHNIEK